MRGRVGVNGAARGLLPERSSRPVPRPAPWIWSRIRARSSRREVTMEVQGGSRGVVEPGARPAGWGLAAALVLFALALLLALQGGPPPAKPASAPAAEFSAGRAQAVLRDLVGDGAPHPVGSPGAARVRERILAQLRSSGFSPEVQEALGCSASGGSCARVSNER